MPIDDVIEHGETKNRFLVTEVMPYNIQIRSVWGYYFKIGKRRLSGFKRIGIKPNHIQRWRWFGEAKEVKNV